MTTNGNWGRMLINGYDLTSDGMNYTGNMNYASNKVMPFNVGVEQYAVGMQTPSQNFSGYITTGQGVLSAHNLLSPSGVGGTNDVEFITTFMVGNNASPAAGDLAILGDATLIDYTRNHKYSDVMQFQGQFVPRGKRWGLGRVIYDNTLAVTKGSQTSAFYDSGANAAPTTKGAIVHFNVTLPTGVAATGNISLSGTPSDGDNFSLTIGGTVYTYTFKTALTPTAGQVLIGGSAATAIANLYAAMVGGQGAGTSYATGTVAIPQYPQASSLVYIAVPTGANVINLTAVNTGTAANAYALVKTGVNLAVSGATMSGGAAGDTITSLVLQSATTSGGSYTTFATSTLDGTLRKSERIEVAIGTTINRYIKAILTMSGSSSNIGINVCFARFWQL